MVDGLSPLAMPEILHMESTADVLQRHCILHELWLDQGPARPEMIKNRPLWDSLAAVCFVFGGWGGGGGVQLQDTQSAHSSNCQAITVAQLGCKRLAAQNMPGERDCTCVPLTSFLRTGTAQQYHTISKATSKKNDVLKPTTYHEPASVLDCHLSSC
jgi:hypothetical protein